MYLHEKLEKYAREGYYPFHMPGHKRNTALMGNFNPFDIDITEIDGFDNLYDAKDVIRKSMKRAAALYESAYTYFLVNGSTSGNLIGICSCTKKGDKILMARNCHKSVYQAVFLNELKPVYLYPHFNQENGIQCGYTAKYIEEMLITNPDVKLIMLVSPTYEGVTSEIAEISEIAHKKGIPVMVDEAHGAHFGFHSAFPKNSVQLGADLVVQSVHKTLPALTQTALLHVNGNLIDRRKLEYYDSVFQSSSPSYLLMSSIDQCMELLEKRGNDLFNSLEIMLNNFYKKIKELHHIKVLLPEPGRDFSKLIISVRQTNMTGPQLYDILLKKYKLQMEMAAKDYVLGICSIGDTEEGFSRLEKALFEIDGRLEKCANQKNDDYELLQNDTVIGQYEVLHMKKRKIELEKSQGMVAGCFVTVYPPGIPILVPGERISADMIGKLQDYQRSGLEIQGICNKKYIMIVNRED